MELLIRPARPGDDAAIVALVNGAYRGEGEAKGWTHEAGLIAGPRITAPGLRGLDRDGSVVLVAEGAGQLLGCVHVARAEPGVCFLGMLAVRVAAQAQGIGRALVAAAERHAREAFGARTMAMHVIPSRAELVAWYERRGYRRTGKLIPFDPPPGVAVLQGPVVFERLEKSLA